MNRTSRKHTGTNRSESGQAIVELALVAPVLLVLVLGIADFCRVFYASISVTNAARAGAQYGIQPAQYGNFAGMQTAATNDLNGLPGFTTTAGNPKVTATNHCVCPGTTNQVTCNGAATCPSNAAPMVWVDVTVTYTFKTITSVPGVPNNVPLTGRAQMRAQ